MDVMPSTDAADYCQLAIQSVHRTLADGVGNSCLIPNLCFVFNSFH